MAVIFTGGRSDGAQEFTSNKRLLLNAVDRFQGRKLQSATISKNEVFHRNLDGPDAGARVDDPDDMERGHNAQSMLSTLRQVADWFGGVHGRRKTMLLFSEGIDYDLSDIIRSYNAPPSSASSIIE